MRLQDEAPVETAEGAEAAAEPANEAVQQAQGAISALTDGDVSTTDLMMLWEAIGWPIVKAVILIIVVMIIAGWVRGFVVKATQKAKVELTLSRFFGNLARWAILILGAITILQTFGIEATSFAAVVAAVGFAIGMALSGTIGNVAAGVMLLVFRPFKVGQVVNAAGVTGKIDEIGLFVTTFDTPDNRRIIVPNGKLFGDTIENISHHDTRRVDVAVGVAYDADVDEARKILEGVCANVEGGLQDPAPVVYLVELGASSVDFALRVWANSPDYWAVRERMTRDAKKALDAAGIGIPFPQRDIHVPEAITVRMDKD